MLGAAGALCCLAAGMAVGSWMKEKRTARARMLEGYLDALGGIRLLLEQERPPLAELLLRSADYAQEQEVAKRLKATAQALKEDPVKSPFEAYAASGPPYGQEEQAALETFFRQMGSGTAAMREQAAAACIRRLRPLSETARTEAERGGKLCMQLGMLMGMMAGIVLW